MEFKSYSCFLSLSEGLVLDRAVSSRSSSNFILRKVHSFDSVCCVDVVSPLKPSFFKCPLADRKNDVDADLFLFRSEMKRDRKTNSNEVNLLSGNPPTGWVSVVL